MAFFGSRDAWRSHPFLRLTHVRQAFPGLGIAAGAFGVYLVFDFATSSRHTPAVSHATSTSTSTHTAAAAAESNPAAAAIAAAAAAGKSAAPAAAAAPAAKPKKALSSKLDDVLSRAVASDSTGSASQ